MGVSTRKVTEITEQLCGTISASQVSRISKLMDDELEVSQPPSGQLSSCVPGCPLRESVFQGSIQPS